MAESMSLILGFQIIREWRPSYSTLSSVRGPARPDSLPKHAASQHSKTVLHGANLAADRKRQVDPQALLGGPEWANERALGMSTLSKLRA